VFGDAGAPGILDAAGVARARLLVVASPDAHQARHLIAIAREANPDIDTLVRTHSDSERRHLEHEGVGLVLMPERELGFGMALYALRSLGVGEGEARLFVDASRADSRGDAAPEPGQGAPELRPHRDVLTDE
jgi:monovalent cation:H+ antiporter-2, CPA2 family